MKAFPAAPVLLVDLPLPDGDGLAEPRPIQNRDPAAGDPAGRFRTDLHHRRYVVPVDLPRLRACGGDIIVIAETLLAICSAQEGRNFRRLAPETREVFRRYHWPGNVRQLQDVLRDAVVLHDSPEVTPSMLPMELRIPESHESSDVIHTDSGAGLAAGFAEPAREPGPEAPAAGGGSGAGDEPAAAAEALVGMSLAEIERLVIEATIRACGDSLPKAARVLGVSPSTLYRKRAGWTDRSGGR